jgi:hypothetical protein
MPVYVDNARLGWRGKLWCHLVADSLEELHVFACRLGLKREWFQSSARYPHYDVTVALRAKALALGAQTGDKATIVACAKHLRSEYVGRECAAPLNLSSGVI